MSDRNDFFYMMTPPKPLFRKVPDKGKPKMSKEKLDALLQLGEIVFYKLERMSEEQVAGYRYNLKVLGEMIQEGLADNPKPVLPPTFTVVS